MEALLYARVLTKSFCLIFREAKAPEKAYADMDKCYCDSQLFVTTCKGSGSLHTTLRSNIFPIMYSTVHLGTATAASELHSTKVLTG